MGYGDFVPTTDGAKLFTVFYIIGKECNMLFTMLHNCMYHICFRHWPIIYPIPNILLYIDNTTVGAYFLFNCFSSLVWTPIKILSLKNEIRVIKQFENNFTEKVCCQLLQGVQITVCLCVSCHLYLA